MKRSLVLASAIAALALAPAAFGQSNTGNDTLNVTVGPEASFTSVDSSTSLTKVDTLFGSFTGTSNFTYKIRTSQSTGTGSITVEVTAFQSHGPLVSDLSYTCTDTASGTPCSSSTAASASVATGVVSFGADAHSSDSGDSGSTSWTRADRPTVKTGNYSTTATFTISAT